MAARNNFSAVEDRGHVRGDVVRKHFIPVDRFTCAACGARCEPDAGIGCHHQVRTISSRHYHSGGITR
ncbi:hypothetical protein [Rhizorhabdus sp.]|uniref:hypothetical protein n=1 Tax=Rhizorhabdus sp. TaxID=1968843 RepID=UPI0035B1A5AC